MSDTVIFRTVEPLSMFGLFVATDDTADLVGVLPQEPLDELIEDFPWEDIPHSPGELQP